MEQVRPGKARAQVEAWEGCQVVRWDNVPEGDPTEVVFVPLVDERFPTSRERLAPR